MDGRQKKKPKNQFPLRTMTINLEFIKNNDGFFIDYDFALMIFVISMLTFIVSCLGKVLLPGMFQTNLVFYMCTFSAMLTIQYLSKNAFFGPSKKFVCSDEVKVQIFLSFKCFCIAYLGFHYLDDGKNFDFALSKGHRESLGRVNQVLAIYNNNLAVPVEVTYILLSLCASILTFSIVKQSVDFAYFLFAMSKQEGLVEKDSESVYTKRKMILST